MVLGHQCGFQQRFWVITTKLSIYIFPFEYIELMTFTFTQHNIPMRTNRIESRTPHIIQCGVGAATSPRPINRVEVGRRSGENRREKTELKINWRTHSRRQSMFLFSFSPNFGRSTIIFESIFMHPVKISNSDFSAPYCRCGVVLARWKKNRLACAFPDIILVRHVVVVGIVVVVVVN